MTHNKNPRRHCTSLANEGFSWLLLKHFVSWNIISLLLMHQHRHILGKQRSPCPRTPRILDLLPFLDQHSDGTPLHRFLDTLDNRSSLSPPTFILLYYIVLYCIQLYNRCEGRATQKMCNCYIFLTFLFPKRMVGTDGDARHEIKKRQ